MAEDTDGGRPLRILEIETFGRGGLLHYSYNLSCALANRGHQVTLLTTMGYELGGEEHPDGLKVERRIARWTQRRRPAGSKESKPWPWFRSLEAVFDALATAWFARRHSADVVHLHSTNSSAVLFLALLRLSGAAVVSTAHVVTPHEPLRFQSRIYGWIHRLPHRVIAHSEVDRSRLQRELAVGFERLDVIPHGEYGFFAESQTTPERRLEARRSLGFEPQHEVVLFFGFIREYKGLDLLLDAWPSVVARRPQARLLLVGDPERLDPHRRSALEAQARELEAVCRFQYVPFEEVSRYFAAADLLVMPYRRISQSGVLFLALSLGVPVLATRVGGLPEMLEDGVDARLVPPEDLDALSKALIELTGDSELRGRLAEGGRRVAANHSWSTIAERTVSCFRELV